jgi:hypothetical protein
LIPLSSHARQVLPVLPLVVARLGVHHLGRDWLRGDVEAAFLTGAGQATAAEGIRAPFRISGTQLSLGATAETALSRSFSVGIGGGAGVLVLGRDYQGTFSGHQSLRATTAFVHLEAGFSPVDRLSLDARLAGTGIFGDLDASKGPHFALFPTVQAAFTF